MKSGELYRRVLLRNSELILENLSCQGRRTQNIIVTNRNTYLSLFNKFEIKTLTLSLVNPLHNALLHSYHLMPDLSFSILQIEVGQSAIVNENSLIHFIDKHAHHIERLHLCIHNKSVIQIKGISTLARIIG